MMENIVSVANRYYMETFFSMQLPDVKIRGARHASVIGDLGLRGRRASNVGRAPMTHLLQTVGGIV